MRIAIKLLSVLFLVCIYVLTGCATGQIPSSELSRAQGNEAKKITLESVCEEILAMPEEQINLGRYALLMTKAVCPDVNLEYELKKIDEMADTVRPRLKGVSDPQKTVEILNEYLFTQLRFTGWELPKDASADYYLLHYALWSKKAHCVTLSVIYLCLAERLNLPIYGVSIPKHFFVRYDDGKTRINIETTSGDGKNRSDDEYLKKHAPLTKETDKEIRDGFLRNITKKEVLAEYLLNAVMNKFLSQETDDNDNSLSKYTDYAIKMRKDYFSYFKKGNILSIIGHEKKDPNIVKQGVEYLLEAYKLYPYDYNTILALSLAYSFLKDYENCLKRIHEIFNTFPFDDIVKLDDVSMLREMKINCEKKLKESKEPSSLEDVLPKPK